MTEPNAINKWKCKRCFDEWYTEQSTPPEKCICCNSSDWSIPRPTKFSNEESDREVLAKSFKTLRDAMSACEDNIHACHQGNDQQDYPWSEMIDISLEFCEKTSVLNKTIREVMWKSENLLVTMMDLGILDQHDPFYQREKSESYWPYFDLKFP